MDSIVSGFTALMTFLSNILTWALDGILWLLGKAFFIPFDGLLTCISSFFKAIDFSVFPSSYALDWAGMPPQMIWFINAVSLPQGVTIIFLAIGIRMLLNLIPAAFTRI